MNSWKLIIMKSIYDLNIEAIVHRTARCENLLIKHAVAIRGIEQLIQKREVDCLVIECEDGFCQLGGMRSFLSEELGMDERNLVKYILDGSPTDLVRDISSLADWCRSNPDVTFVAIPSTRPGSQLKGLILAPYDSCTSYKKYAVPEY